MIALADAFGVYRHHFCAAFISSIQILWRRRVSHRRVPGAAALVSDLIARHELIMTTIQAMDEPPPLSVTSSLERLAQLIMKADPIIQKISQAETAEGELIVFPQAQQKGSDGSRGRK